MRSRSPLPPLAAAPARLAGERPAAPLVVRPTGYWTGVWRRLRRDRLAVGAAGLTLVLVLLAFVGGPLAARALGHGPDEIFPAAVDESLVPAGPLTHVRQQPTLEDPRPGTTLLLLGADGPLGRDELLRLLYGGQVSLEVAVGGTLLSLLIGIVLGSVAGYAGGFVDAGVARLTEFVMAFPVLLFLIMLGATVSDHLDAITLGGLLHEGVVSLVVLIGALTWYYPARVMRSQVVSLREREFVEAARMMGAGNWRIVRTHLLPHLLPSATVLFTLMVGTNVMLEAGISFLGVGIKLPTASWGSLLAQTWGTLLHPNISLAPTTPSLVLTLWPCLCIFLTVLGLTLLGEALRQAMAPRRVH